MALQSTCAITHDDPEQTVIVMDAFPEGTKTYKLSERIAIPPGEPVDHVISALVTPVVGTPGQTWTGRLVLVDQFRRRHKTEKIAFDFWDPLNPP